MKTFRKIHSSDRRVKQRIFPVSIFAIMFLAFGFFTTIQMHYIGEYIDYRKIPSSHAIAILAMWILAAATFALVTGFGIHRYFQKPVEEFAEAIKKVASGDFSVYVAPRHTPDRADHLDVMMEDFNKMVEELGSIETLKTDFFSNVSHEIKTPIAVIDNYAQLLQRPDLTEEARKEYTEMILHATRRLSSLITNMLKLNKLEKQVIRPVPQPFDLCGQLCRCALQFEEQWEKKGIAFDVEIEDRFTIEADEGLMEMVWTNLLSNAVKFTPEGGRIRLTETSDRQWVTVQISDTGCGMDEETLRHSFDKFYQGDTSHATEGNGLGLALVQRILQLSEGTISVKSQPGQGTEFTVILPAVPHSEEEKA